MIDRRQFSAGAAALMAVTATGARAALVNDWLDRLEEDQAHRR